MFKKIYIVYAANPHAFMIFDFDEVDLFQSSNTRRSGYDFPMRCNGKVVVSPGEYPVIYFYSFRVYRNRAESEERAVEKPQNNGQPDGGGQKVLGLLFYERIKEKRQYQAQCKKHDAVLNPKGFYNKKLSVHNH
ncbi:MAG: hypothetical protein J7M20_06055 [Deltaproteobacteria bacterium]|nr:hypothetical protein [Deltaproteobacteria bacterium]